jgi:hypothetical protein
MNEDYRECFRILRYDSATLQSTQWIINAGYNQCPLQHYNQRLFSLRDLTTKYEANTCLSFTTVITTSVVQDLKEKNR